MTQFKDKTKHLNNDGDFHSENSQSKVFINSGLLMYPVLMVTYILLYNATQFQRVQTKQHLELCRNLAQRFNHKYSDTLISRAVYCKARSKNYVFAGPTQKSKSDVNQNATLFL